MLPLFIVKFCINFNVQKCVIKILIERLKYKRLKIGFLKISKKYLSIYWMICYKSYESFTTLYYYDFNRWKSYVKRLEDFLNKTTFLTRYFLSRTTRCINARKICILFLTTKYQPRMRPSRAEESRRGNASQASVARNEGILPGNKTVFSLSSRGCVYKTKSWPKKRRAETVFTKMCRAQAAYATRRHGHSFRSVSLFSSLVHLHSVSLFLSLSFSLTLSLSPFVFLSCAPARIFFFNLIYRQFDGRKTRRHFCLSPYSPAGPGPSFHPHVARRKAIKIHNPGHTPRG